MFFLLVIDLACSGIEYKMYQQTVKFDAFALHQHYFFYVPSNLQCFCCRNIEWTVKFTEKNTQNYQWHYIFIQVVDKDFGWKFAIGKVLIVENYDGILLVPFRSVSFHFIWFDSRQNIIITFSVCLHFRLEMYLIAKFMHVSYCIAANIIMVVARATLSLPT